MYGFLICAALFAKLQHFWHVRVLWALLTTTSANIVLSFLSHLRLFKNSSCPVLFTKPPSEAHSGDNVAIRRLHWPLIAVLLLRSTSCRLSCVALLRLYLNGEGDKTSLSRTWWSERRDSEAHAHTTGFRTVVFVLSKHEKCRWFVGKPGQHRF